MARLDMEERLFRAFRELLLSDTEICNVAGDRIWIFGDASHKAEYPCVLLNLPDATVSGMAELGWYEMHLQILAAVYRPDDKDLSGLRELEGLIRGFCQQTNLPALLTATLSATRESTALTVVDARIENDVAEEEGAQAQIYAGTTLCVVCAPHNANVRPSPSPHETGGGGTETPSGEPIENTQQNPEQGE